MAVWARLLLSLAAAYAALVVTLCVVGRRAAARTLALFGPDCSVLVRRLARPVVVAEHWLGSRSALAILSRVAAPRSPRAGAVGGRRRPWG